MPLVFKDSGGNRLFKKVLKGGRTQIYAKNRRGGLVDEASLRTLMHRAGMKFRKL